MAFEVTTDHRATGSQWHGPVAVVIPYEQFLERRAWRAKRFVDARGSSEGEIRPEGPEVLVPNTNPGRVLTCPVCPKSLIYVTTRHVDGHVHQKQDAFKTVADVHVYECPNHGRYHVGPNGRLVEGA